MRASRGGDVTTRLAPPPSQRPCVRAQTTKSGWPGDFYLRQASRVCTPRGHTKKPGVLGTSWDATRAVPHL